MGISLLSQSPTTFSEVSYQNTSLLILLIRVHSAPESQLREIRSGTESSPSALVVMTIASAALAYEALFQVLPLSQLM